jgi:hypothetical protein
MAYEFGFNRSRIEQIIVLAGLVLFLVLPFLIPA